MDLEKYKDILFVSTKELGWIEKIPVRKTR